MAKSAASRSSIRERMREYYDRGGLAKKTRLLVSISVLTLLGKTKDLEDVFDWAIERRVSVNRIREAILQTMLFAGYPRAIHAFETLDGVLSRRGLKVKFRTDRLPPRSSSRPFFRRRGRELFEEIYRGDTAAVTKRIAGFHPEFMDWILEDAYGQVLARPFLDLKTRELIAVALLAVLGLPRQLTPHMRGALRAGARLREVSETVRQQRLFLSKAAVEAALIRLERANTTL